MVRGEDRNYVEFCAAAIMPALAFFLLPYESRRGSEQRLRASGGSVWIMVFLKVMITRYVRDEPQPGIIECTLVDAHGHCWRFVEKTAVVSAEYLGPDTVYPQEGVIAGEVVGRNRDDAGRDVLLVDTERPWGVESVEGVTRFAVFSECVVEE